MMSHLDEGRLQELLDGEIPSLELPPIQAHLASCAECRVRLEEAREWAGAADQLIESIELPERAPPDAAPIAVPARRTPWGRHLAWAATVVIAVGAGYAARGPLVVTPPSEAAPAQSDAPAPAPLEAERGVVDSLVASAPGKSTSADARRTRETATNQAPPGAPVVRAEPRAAPPPAALAQAAGKVSAFNLAAGVRESSATRADSALKKERKLDTTQLHLDELVVTSTAEQRLKAAAAPAAEAARRPASPADNELSRRLTGRTADMAHDRSAITELDFSDAVRRMGGSLRLIDGLIPLRLEALADEVRVVYPTARGELVLAQKLVDGKVSFRLIAPTGFPADSLERLRARVRE